MDPTTVSIEQDTEDGLVLYLVLGDERPWSVAELGREMGSEIAARDAVGRLRRAGLLHQLSEGYVFPSRATRRAYELLTD